MISWWLVQFDVLYNDCTMLFMMAPVVPLLMRMMRVLAFLKILPDTPISPILVEMGKVCFL